MARRRRKQPPPRRASRGREREPAVVRLVEYEITYEPLEDPRLQRLSEGDRAEIERLHFRAREHPREAIPELQRAIERWPGIPALYNYLTVAYSATGQDEKAEETTLETLRRFPDYLFARLNYAEMCLRRGQVEKVAELLDHKFDLTLLYPQRRTFHISEAVAFMGIVGSYFAAKAEHEIAERYCKVLEQLDPEHMITRRLRDDIDRSRLLRLLDRAKSRLPRLGRRPKGERER
jgi:tetratricopeptide (TPR) repeat protein